ncbi:MAG: hypothetical protein LBV33_04290 [Lachnospiraceae bacterium]|jgi:hypothetical protein|nr:hypothetical protein [Lachnospiraceae bacterium]
MTSLLVAKQYIKNFIAKYEVYLLPVGKFLMSTIILMMINGSIGYMTRLDNFAVVLVVALMCSFMPINFIIFVGALFIVAHLYAVSLECAIVVLAIMLLLFLLYFRFSPRDTLVVLLMPVCFFLKIPYVIPISMGMLGTPLAAVSTACGIIIYYSVDFIADNATALSGMSADDMATKFRYIIDGIINNKAMMVTVVAFAVTIIVVYVIRRMAIDHAWMIAAIAGALVDIVILLLGDLILDTQVSVLGAIIGTAVSIGIVKIVEFFAFNIDYSRAESVQFEDDEYYYYVKAVPKITVAAPSRTVKQIHSAKRRPR